MREIVIERYTAANAGEWDEMVRKARNATFLFLRGYMDYHSDRFADHSLMARSGGKLIALLPANEVEDESGEKVLQSHGGLTYGGWILPRRHTDAADMLGIFEKLSEYAMANGVSRLDYKTMPDIYCAMPSEEDRYALFRAGARLTECNISCAINLRNNPGFNTLQKRNLKKGEGKLEIYETTDTGIFHNLLSKCLEERHGVKPVHTAGELELLRSRFPENIRIFMAGVPAKSEGERGEPEAGVCIFDTGRVVHAQYICSSESGRRKGVLTKLFSYLINEEFAEREYFDFGISNESHGWILNEGLYGQKSGLGGSGVAYERYEIRYE